MESKMELIFSRTWGLKFTVRLSGRSGSQAARKLIECTEELGEEEKRARHAVTKDLQVGLDTMLSDQAE